jgi:hypothetical protein
VHAHEHLTFARPRHGAFDQRQRLQTLAADFVRSHARNGTQESNHAFAPVARRAERRESACFRQ